MEFLVGLVLMKKHEMGRICPQPSDFNKFMMSSVQSLKRKLHLQLSCLYVKEKILKQLLNSNSSSQQVLSCVHMNRDYFNFIIIGSYKKALNNYLARMTSHTALFLAVFSKIWWKTPSNKTVAMET